VRKSFLVKLALGLGALALFGFLFIRSLDTTRAEPYTVERRHLSGWALVTEAASGPNEPLLSLRPPPELASGMFREVLARTMESLKAPAVAAIPLVLRGEFDRVLGDQLTADGLLAAARTAGLESANLTPVCLVHRRVSEPGGTKQVYFLVFDAPAVPRFRQQLGLDGEALSPVLFVAGAGPDFNSWLPLRVDVSADCLAPVKVTPEEIK